jgi:hypothetical protein
MAAHLHLRHWWEAVGVISPQRQCSFHVRILALGTRTSRVGTIGSETLPLYGSKGLQREARGCNCWSTCLSLKKLPLVQDLSGANKTTPPQKGSQTLTSVAIHQGPVQRRLTASRHGDRRSIPQSPSSGTPSCLILHLLRRRDPGAHPWRSCRRAPGRAVSTTTTATATPLHSLPRSTRLLPVVSRACSH